MGDILQKKNIKGGKLTRELLSDIKSRINSGEDRQSIFTDLSTKFVERDWLASFIANVPNPEDIQKMKKGTTFILIALCIYTATHIISILLFMIPMIGENNKLLIMLPMTFLWPAIAIWCILQIRKYHGASYRFVGLISLVLVLNNLRGLIDRPPNDVASIIITTALLSMLVACSFIAFKIRKKFFPHITYFGVKKENGAYVLSKS